MATERNLVDGYANTGVSCPDLCRKYDVEVREFVLLACLKDLGNADTALLEASIGLSHTTIHACVINLLENGLIKRSAQDLNLLNLAADGRALLRKAESLT